MASIGHRHARVAVLVMAAALAAVTASCGSAGRSGSRPPGPATTSPAGCPHVGSTAASAGAARITRVPEVSLLQNVQIQASSCVDEISFLFMGGVPGWSAGYRTGPLSEDPSGRTAGLAGSAHLVVRFTPAAGVDLAADPPAVTYDGPTDMRPPAPSGVVELRRLGDFESVTTWAVGLSGRRPFQVVTRGDQLVLRVPAPAPRPTHCAAQDPGLSVGYPAGWYAELSARWACRYFGPAPFVVYPATDRISWAVTVQEAGTSAAAFVTQMTSGGSLGLTVRSAAVRVAGLPATLLDITESGQGMYPAGYQMRMYVVDTGARALTIESAPAPRGSQADRGRSAADEIAARMART